MSGAVANRKRLLRVTKGNCRNSHIYLTGHYDFFPKDCIGGSKRKNGTASGIRIFLTGLDREIETDIGTDVGTGKPRKFFRGRAWVRDFFEKHSIGPGDVLALERTGPRSYRLYPFETQRERCDDWHDLLDDKPPGRGPTILELFAGCGGMALGFKKAGFRTAMCNEWDAAACESLRKNITDRVAQCAIQEIDRFPAADVIAGGLPCQGFSNLGERVPNDPRNQLWRQYVRAVQDVRPKVFVLENVPPLFRSQEYAELVRILEAEGYTIEGRVLNAADYGVPQTRKGAFAMGLRGAEPSHSYRIHAGARQSLKAA